jgi:tRNA threonylcarbamoyladenosine biosynthesis protein TsaE
MTEFSRTTHSPEETEALAANLAGALHGGTLLLLSGELGAGKSCFTRGLLRGLNAPPDVTVTSPTYVLQHVYRGGRLTVYHIDAYRLRGGADEFEASGLEECLNDAGGIVCMEWPELAGASQPREPRIEIAIEHEAWTERSFTFRAFGAAAEDALRVLDVPTGI